MSTMNGSNGTLRAEDRVAMVTGASKGIGRAIAVRLAWEGARVGITWFRDEAGAKETANEIESFGGTCVVTQATLGEPNAARDAVRAVERELGSIDILVSNAATGVFRPMRDLKPRHLDWTLETNAKAFLRLCQAARKISVALTMTSIGSLRAQPGYGSVGVSKAALEAMVRYLAVELAPSVRVNAIHAGVVDTSAIRNLFPGSEALVDGAAEATPMRRLVTPDEVASLAAFLASDEASMITGQVVTIDGGFSAKV